MFALKLATMLQTTRDISRLLMRISSTSWVFVIIIPVGVVENIQRFSLIPQREDKGHSPKHLTYKNHEGAERRGGRSHVSLTPHRGRVSDGVTNTAPPTYRAMRPKTHTSKTEIALKCEMTETNKQTNKNIYNNNINSWIRH